MAVFTRALPLLAALALSLAGPGAALASTTIWAVGDGAAAGDTDDRVGQMIGAQSFDDFLYLGDVYDTGTAADFATKYESAYGDYKAKTRPTPGNHEWGNRLTGYDPYWGPAYSSPHYYSFDSGSWHVISLNSEEPSGMGSAQRNWLQADIAQHPGTCTLAFWHRPRYAATSRTTEGFQLGNTPSTSGLWDSLEQHASIVLAGHSHNYQRLMPIDEITTFVVGTGGEGDEHHTFVDPAPADSPEAAYLNDTDFGALELTLAHRQADFRFVDLAGTTRDSGTITCELPPTATAGEVGKIDSDAATVSGSVNPEGAATTYHFEYGTTTQYGASTPSASASVGGTQAVSADLSGLADDTAYYYRLVASNRHGTTYGLPRTLRTATLETAIGAVSAALGNDPSPMFGYSSSQPDASFECSIDTGIANFAPCSGAEGGHRPASPLVDGSYAFRVRAVDAAGNRDETPATYDFTVDTKAPAVAIDRGPTAATSDTTPSFGFSSEAGASLECSLDAEAPSFGPCSGPDSSHRAASALGDGSYSFRVRATDAANNSAVTTRSFSVDTGVPQTTITDRPPRKGEKRRAAVGFASSESGGWFECSLDKRSFVACTSPTVQRVKRGRHIFRVRAIDAAGNVDSSPAKAKFRLSR